MPKFVSVLLPRLLPRPFSYSVPDDTDVNIGDYVEAPLGNKSVIGVVWAKDVSNPDKKKIKPIIRKMPAPAMPDNMRKFIEKVADYTLSPIGNVLKMSLSAPEGLDDAAKIEVLKATGKTPDKMTQQREAVLKALNSQGELSSRQIKDLCIVGDSVIKSLLADGAIEKIKVDQKPLKPEFTAGNINFSPAQNAAAGDLKNKVREQKFSVTVLDGVTGSGKTEVFFAAVEEALKNEDNQVLIMLPEIALTGQIIDRFIGHFGFEPTCWHSNLTKATRSKNWRDIASGNARLVIGARSALFLPYKKLALIVVDEEHDGSYKQEEGVIYHGRDMAVLRCHIENIPIVLASATPSIETVENVKSGKYDCLKLPSRHGGAVMPDVKAVDMRKEKLKAGFWLSSALKKALVENMANGKQALLFLNRRGYAPLTLCRNCGYRFKCPDCSSWLVEHKSHNKLMCHHCEYQTIKPEECPECEKEDSLVSCGPGVERIAEEVAASFPQAQIEVMTSDKITSMSRLSSAVNDITSGKTDIIIGTQVIAKGYHFPDLKLVGVIDADLGMEGGDLRASERTFQLLQQVSGRAGRESEQGKVILQSYMPDNMLMRALEANDRDKFIDSERKSRKITNMPPYSRLAAIIISGKNEMQALNFSKSLVRSAPSHEEVEILGPVPAPMHLLRGNYRFRILIRCARNINIQKWIRNLMDNHAPPSSIKVKVDIDPYSFM